MFVCAVLQKTVNEKHCFMQNELNMSINTKSFEKLYALLRSATVLECRPVLGSIVTVPHDLNVMESFKLSAPAQLPSTRLCVAVLYVGKLHDKIFDGLTLQILVGKQILSAPVLDENSRFVGFLDTKDLCAVVIFAIEEAEQALKLTPRRNSLSRASNSSGHSTSRSDRELDAGGSFAIASTLQSPSPKVICHTPTHSIANSISNAGQPSSVTNFGFAPNINQMGSNSALFSPHPSLTSLMPRLGISHNQQQRISISASGSPRMARLESGVSPSGGVLSMPRTPPPSMGLPPVSAVIAVTATTSSAVAAPAMPSSFSSTLSHTPPAILAKRTMTPPLVMSPPPLLVNQQTRRRADLSGDPLHGITNKSMARPYAHAHLPHTASLFEAAEILATGIHRVAILDERGVVVNIISQSAIVAFMAKNSDALVSELEVSINGIGSHPVIAVRETETAFSCYRLLVDRHLSGVPIISSAGEWIGVASCSDLKVFIQNPTPEFLSSTIISFLSKVRQEYTEARSLTIGVSTTCSLFDAVHKFAATQVHRIFVSESSSQTLLGVVSLTDVLHHFFPTAVLSTHNRATSIAMVNSAHVMPRTTSSSKSTARASSTPPHTPEKSAAPMP